MRYAPIAVAGLLVPLLASGSQRSAVSPGEASEWLRHAVPLPREMTINAKVTLAPGELAVKTTGSSPIAMRAREELQQKAGLEKSGSAAGSAPTAFVISLELGGPDAEALRSLKNSDQACRMLPAADGAAKGLRIVALGPRGLYYGAKTIQQLLRSAGNRLEVPLLSGRDWPEMADRGLWGVDSYDRLEWLADRKINYIEQIAAPRVDPSTKRGVAEPKAGHEPLVRLGPTLGIQFVPVVLHLEQLDGKGLFEAYPQLRGKRGGKPGVICYSQAEFVGILADWIEQLARVPHVTEVDVWMTENLAGGGGCKCDQCRKTDHNLLELRAILAAWREVRARGTKTGLRVLTSEETYRSHQLIFPELPQEVKLWYYHSLLTYTSTRTPMITGHTAKLAASGHWVGVCPSLVAHVGFPEPFSSADFVHYRVTEYHQHKLQGIIGYPSPRVGYARFNVEAMAEWTWNPSGRSPREFAISWATRQKISKPETFADWAELHSRVAGDVYGSDWPAGELRKVPGHVADLLVKSALPGIGSNRYGLYYSPWGQFQSADQIRAHARSEARAVDLAREIGVPEFIQESLVVQGYIDSLNALLELRDLLAPQRAREPAAAKTQFAAYEKALKQARQGLLDWEETVATSSSGGSTGKSVKKLEELIEEMRTAASKLPGGR